MPTYDYRCNACGHTFEVFQGFSEKTKRKCPECGKPKLERLIGTGAGMIFKGAGFYLTDYRSDSYKAGAEAEKKASEAASETPSAKGGDKPTDKATDKSSEKPVAEKSTPKKVDKPAAKERRD
ncbi:MAG: FmdB family zinc ribbon protein [Planctomycetota bacterium]